MCSLWTARCKTSTEIVSTSHVAGMQRAAQCRSEGKGDGESAGYYPKASGRGRTVRRQSAQKVQKAATIATSVYLNSSK